MQHIDRAFFWLQVFQIGLAVAAVSVFLAMTPDGEFLDSNQTTPVTVLFFSTAIFTGCALVSFWTQQIVISKQLRLLQHGILSEEACALIWPAVILAHHRALEAADEQGSYLEALATEAVEFVKYHDKGYDLQGWIRGESHSTESA